MASIRFRDDINGLRAVAVTAVVLFHFNVGFVSGGFAGVDVFFVISGYLMTAIITRRLEENRFSLFGFYGDRARRIVPPLYAMILSLFIFGYFFIDPYTYQKLGSTGVSALLFFSNFRFWEATGYFDAKSSTKWLLHTWSLSVEWQFYLIYPIVLFGLERFMSARAWRLAALWILTLASLGACIAWSPAHPASTFYLLPFRAWEMLAGGLIALQFDHAPENKTVARGLMVIGLICIGFACFTFDVHRPWPYYWAAIPVLGTCLVIAARRTAAPVFANPVSRFIGEWSYSIYLWHWPLAVAIRYFDFQGFLSFAIAGRAALLVAALLVAIFIATRLRKRLANHALLGWGAGFAASGLAVAFAIFIASGNGLPGRIQGGRELFESYNRAAEDWTYPPGCVGAGIGGGLRPCHLGAATPGTLFIGDSFAMQLYPRFADLAAVSPQRSFTFVTDAGCPAILGFDHNDGSASCSSFMDKAFEFAAAGNYRRIVLVSNWYEYFSVPNETYCFRDGAACSMKSDPDWYKTHADAAFTRTAERLTALKQKGAEIVILASTPTSRFDVPIELAKRRFFGSAAEEVEFLDRVQIERDSAPARAELAALAQASGATLIDPLPYLCDSKRCATIDQTGGSLFVDAIHYRSDTVKGPRFAFLDALAGPDTTTH